MRPALADPPAVHQMPSIARSLSTMLLAAAAAAPVSSAGEPPKFEPGPADSAQVADMRLFAFAKQFERAVNNRDAAAINVAFDVEALLDRAADGLIVSASQRRSFAESAGLASAADPYLAAVGTSGHVRMLKVREVGGGPRALYRIVGDRGLDYHDAVIEPTDNGGFVIVDAYVLTTGEMMSTSLRRQLVDHLDFDLVVPERNDDHVGTDLVALNEMVIRKKWDELIETAARVEAAVGDDPYLDMLRAYALCGRGSYDRAAEAADRSIHREPMLEEARLIRLRVALAERDYDAVADSLTVLERDFGWTLDGLAGAPAYAGFVHSPSYNRWMIERETALAE